MKKVKKVRIILFSALTIVGIFIILMGISIWGYNQNFGHRVEYIVNENETTFEKLSNVKRERVSFETSNENKLSGFIYTGKEQKTTKAMVVFVHGFGGTHQWGPYLKEFSYLIDNGYSVFAYDNTGCGMSEGNSMIGLSQSIIDLDYALKFIEKQQSLPIVLYGHSWGGFTASAILNINHDVVAVVERSGFNSGKDIVFERGKNMVGFLMNISSPFTSFYEYVRFGKYSGYTAVDGINKANIPVLIMHSKDDQEVPYKLSIASKASDITNPNAIIHNYNKKSHDISLSDNALAYRKTKDVEWRSIEHMYGSDIPKNILNTYYSNYDYKQAEELDITVMDKIIKFFDEALLIKDK